jgi:hypothetical protein
MELLLDSSGPAIDQLASLDSVRLLRDPFPVVSTNLLSLSSDPNTRVIVFVRNLQLVAGETASAVTVNLVDGNNQVFDVPAEIVRPVANTDFVQVIFRLPGDLGPGKCTLMLKAHGQLSNRGSIRIKT